MACCSVSWTRYMVPNTSSTIYIPIDDILYTILARYLRRCIKKYRLIKKK